MLLDVIAVDEQQWRRCFLKHGGIQRTRRQVHTSIRSFQSVFCVVHLHELGMEIIKESYKMIFAKRYHCETICQKTTNRDILSNQFYAALPRCSAPKRGEGRLSPFKFSLGDLCPPPPYPCPSAACDVLIS